MIVGNRYEDGDILELGLGVRRGAYSAAVPKTHQLPWAKVDTLWLLARDVRYSVVTESLFWLILKRGSEELMHEMVVTTSDRG